ncbi:hypothetical protein [Paracoccus spongiarum]|uniref:Glycosyltransferase n=1 Tax=Paracoccus spongiarum TaxID=3064387 RepID=A0ABT9JCK6_9RHOB|nr:hypothetical protein [Paracoccus sp. 2205BS29-5]MDP5307551.1 hypothetical protein [Paracoccus sp. 2205BS29-5]
MIRVWLGGRHARRTPISYRWLAPLWDGRVAIVEDPAQADLAIFAHCLDAAEAPEPVIRAWRDRGLPLVWLSEEPFWDTIWGGAPMASHIVVDSPLGALPLRQVNHQTSAVFRFDRLPYYILTNPRFLDAYRRMFARNAARSLPDWRADFAARPVEAAFMFERRPEPRHDVEWAEGDLYGLCARRTRIVERWRGASVERHGASWGNGPTRFDLQDWHADKIATLDGRARILGAWENTHQPDYITEKMFDAFACGALPLYHASPEHRVHDLGLPAESWLNTWDLDEGAIAEAARARLADPAFLPAYRAAQARLRDLLTTGAEQAERERLGRAVVVALDGLCDGLETAWHRAPVPPPRPGRARPALATLLRAFRSLR